VEQILIVLIKNAAQAMASREQRRLSISARRLGERVRVEVADTGGGMLAEIERRVFKAFATTKPLGVGMGLGLANARQLARANGIELSFASTRGVGTTFALEFDTAGVRAGDRNGEGSLSGRILLVVGDEPECLERTRSILENAGAQALVATSQADAVQLLRVHSVEAIVCDDAMYPVRGREFAAQMRDIYRGPICLLAAPEASDALESSSAVDAIIAKPLDAQALVESLNTLVR
jgi:CheY-like chemotaxis protein